MKFAIAKNFIKRGIYDKFYRDFFVQRSYDIYKMEVLKDWSSMTDKMMHEIFGFECDMNENNKKFIKNIPNIATIRLTENEFPYHFSDPVKHHLLWKLGTKISNQDIDHTLKIIKGEFDVLDHAYWENPIELKSVKDLDHAHIISYIDEKLKP